MRPESNLTVIPARGGSKGIPDKNLQLLAGEPLVGRTIRLAQQARLVDRIVVSTDDEQIGEVSRAYGAEVVWRPEAISGDSAPSEAALLHVLSMLEREEGYRPALLTFLQCTSPLTLPEDIDGTINLLLRERAHAAFTAAPFHRFLWADDRSGNLVGVNHDHRFRPRRQDRRPELLETGAVYVMRARLFRETGHRFFGRTVAYLVPPTRALEIDDLADLHRAAALLQSEWAENTPMSVPARPVSRPAPVGG